MESLNDLLFLFCTARSKNLLISGPILQSNALAFAGDLRIEGFHTSNGWLTSWKQRYDIKQFKVSGERAGVDLGTVEDFKSRIVEILVDYDPKNVFNCDETGLFYHALPDKTPTLKGDKVKGGKSAFLFYMSQCNVVAVN